MENTYPFCIEVPAVCDLAPGSSLSISYSASTAVARGLNIEEKGSTEFVIEQAKPSDFLKEACHVSGWFPKLGIKATGCFLIVRRKGWMRASLPQPQ